MNFYADHLEKKKTVLQHSGPSNQYSVYHSHRVSPLAHNQPPPPSLSLSHPNAHAYLPWPQNAEGVVLHVPMPGHVVGTSMLETTRASYDKLDELYDRHDVVFLLLDSREARWLPTLMCASRGRIAINAALGFDSYTVQRHGTRQELQPGSPDVGLQNPGGKDLGCYFCNDVTQPGNVSVAFVLSR